MTSKCKPYTIRNNINFRIIDGVLTMMSHYTTAYDIVPTHRTPTQTTGYRTRFNCKAFARAGQRLGAIAFWAWETHKFMSSDGLSTSCMLEDNITADCIIDTALTTACLSYFSVAMYNNCKALLTHGSEAILPHSEISRNINTFANNLPSLPGILGQAL